jgi:hypothetical protein
MKKVRVWMAAVLVAAALGLIFTARPGSAAGDVDEAAIKAARAEVEKIAAAIKSGDMDGAKKMAAATKKHDLENIMWAFKPKAKLGIGFGAGDKLTDGIEVKYREVARDGAKAKEVPLFEQMGYITQAVALVAEARTPDKDKGKGTVKGWQTAVKDMMSGGQDLVKASKAKGAAESKVAATKVNNACNACHAEWRNN